MKDTKSLKWIIKNGKKEIPKILIFSVSNIVLALVSTALALVSKYAIDAAQKAAVSKVQSDFCLLQKSDYFLWNSYISNYCIQTFFADIRTKFIHKSSGRNGNANAF